MTHQPITIWVEGPPMGKARARVFQSRGRTVAKTPGKTKRQQGVIAIKARLEMKGRQPLVGPIARPSLHAYPVDAHRC